jgi:hypothetical protein
VHIRLRHMLLYNVLPNLSLQFCILSCLLFATLKWQLYREHRILDRTYEVHPQLCSSNPSGRRSQNSLHLRISARIYYRLWTYNVFRRYPCTIPLEVEELGTSYLLFTDGIAATRPTELTAGLYVLCLSCGLQTDHPAICQLFWRDIRTPLFSLECRSYQYGTNNC